MRKSRKIDHINNALSTPDQAEAGFKDVQMLHQSLPEVNWNEIDTTYKFLGKQLAAPLMINAMTGGHPGLKEINRNLAWAAKETGTAIALGSQKAALDDESVVNTYTVVREENPDGIVIANLSAACTLGEANRAVEMVRADAIQLHVNAPQEMAMTEGDRDFRGIMENITSLVQRLDVPVLIKEVGFGMSMETVHKMHKTGARIIDVSGRGGTNFIAIEEGRLAKNDNKYIGDISGWGISTVASLVEVKELHLPLEIVASGGVRTSYDIAKSIALGASVAGISRPFLQTLIENGREELYNHIQQLIEGLKKIMLMSGSVDILHLQQVPLVIGGETASWLKTRGIDISKFARKS
ncbi:MAG: type 2 isopentenyl-diphosphate Delta-isomerase [Firmicutes bacterium]|nr:type 2 isopentenyl-diphosphate Delta-isomerase [Bacillota bacterium]